MLCNTKDCEWNGELAQHQTFVREGRTFCGLCSQPASEKVVRRDEEAEDQPELAAEAEQEWSDDAELEEF